MLTRPTAVILRLVAAAALWVACGEDHVVAGILAAPAAQDDQVKGAVAALFPKFFPNGVAHSIPLGSIDHGGPPKDGIPALTRPNVIAANAVDYLDDDDIVLGLEVNGQTRAYPIRIMNWHEIVNDTLGGGRSP